jgi:hypothetical protein
MKAYFPTIASSELVVYRLILGLVQAWTQIDCAIQSVVKVVMMSLNILVWFEWAMLFRSLVGSSPSSQNFEIWPESQHRSPLCFGRLRFAGVYGSCPRSKTLFYLLQKYLNSWKHCQSGKLALMKLQFPVQSNSSRSAKPGGLCQELLCGRRNWIIILNGRMFVSLWVCWLGL